MFKFKAGAHVRLTHSIEDLGLNTRMTGIVWALYRTVPKSYEVKFTDSDGKALDVLLCESELTLSARRAEKKRTTPNPLKFAASAIGTRNLSARKV